MKQRLPSVLLRLVSLFLLFSVLFSVLGINVNAADDEDPAVITIASDKLEYSGIVVADGSSQGMNFTQLIEKTSMTKNGIKYTGFKMPKSFYDGGNSLTIHFSAYNPVTIRADHEYSIDFHFYESYAMKADISVSVYIYNSNGTVYKNKQIYTEQVPNNVLSPRDLNFNFSLPKSDLPDGYYCRFVVSISQHSSGSIDSSVTNTFYLSDIILTDLDNNVGWFQKIINAIKSIPENIKNFFTNLGESIGNFFTELWSKLKTQFENIGKWFSELGDKIGQFFEDLYNDIIEGLKSLFIPKDGYFDEWSNSWKDWAADHLGILYQIGDIVISILDKIDNLFEDDYVFTFPEISVPVNGKTYVISEHHTVDISYWISTQPTTSRLYSIYTACVWAILVFCLLKYAFKLETIILGTVISS